MQKRIFLYRSLLSLIKTPRSEDEVIRFVVDALYEQFPQYRVSFNWLSPEGVGHIVYTRQPVGQVSLSGLTLDISKTPWFQEALKQGQAFVVNDVRKDPRFVDYVEKLVKMGANLSRIDVPFSDPDGNVMILAMTSPTPTEWPDDTVNLFKEMSELVGLILREARTREKLQRSEATFRQFADNVGVVFWLTDIAKKEIVYVSPAYEKIWGRSVESLYRDPLSFVEAVHPDDRERVRAAVQRQAIENYEQIYRVVWPSGEVRWVKDRGFHIRDEHGDVFRVCGIAEDITPLREAQERLEATQAQVVSNAKFAALGEMASGIAHEINNPLAVIHGLTVQLQELFRKQNASTPMVLDSLGSMEKMANRIAAIVKGLRTFSRQTKGDPMLPADLSLIVQETMALCEARLRAADVKVTVSLPMTRVKIRCRSSEISQVLLNLVSNAYDAVTGVETRAIHIEVQLDAGVARIAVEDSGPGIEPSVRDRIFQPFYTTKEVGRGTGLGLSISKGIVEAHGGRMYLDTSSRKTRFVVELPAESI